MTATVVAGERRGASELHAVPFLGRGFHFAEGNLRSEDFSVQGHEWRWACKERKAMPLFDQHGLEKQNGRVKEVAASLTKGAILALGKRTSLPHEARKRLGIVTPFLSRLPSSSTILTRRCPCTPPSQRCLPIS